MRLQINLEKESRRYYLLIKYGKRWLNFHKKIKGNNTKHKRSISQGLKFRGSPLKERKNDKTIMNRRNNTDKKPPRYRNVVKSGLKETPKNVQLYEKNFLSDKD